MGVLGRPAAPSEAQPFVCRPSCGPRRCRQLPPPAVLGPTGPSAGSCKLDLLLFSGEVANLKAAWLYPFNALSNRALANVQTEVLIILDVDFWPSVEVSEMATDPRK